MSNRQRSIVPLILIGLAGCVVLCLLGLFLGNTLWDAANRSSLAKDVAEVLAAPDLAPGALACHMAGRTRTGYCLFETDQALVKDIANRLHLEGRTTAPEAPRTIPPLVVEGAVGCFAAGVGGSAEGLPAYWAGGRPPQLALSGGGQFEYLLLLYNPATRQTCVQVSYAYG